MVIKTGGPIHGKNTCHNNVNFLRDMLIQIFIHASFSTNNRSQAILLNTSAVLLL
jgi:hypothetical protein